MNIHNLKRLVSLDHRQILDGAKLEEKSHVRRPSSPFEVVKLETWKETNEIRHQTNDLEDVMHSTSLSDANLPNTTTSKDETVALDATSSLQKQEKPEQYPPPPAANLNATCQEHYQDAVDNPSGLSDAEADTVESDPTSFPPDSPSTSLLSSERFTELTSSQETTSECGDIEQEATSSDDEDSPERDKGQWSPVDKSTFLNHFDKEGRLVYEHELRKLIFKGGVEGEIRKEAWTFLFELYPCNSTLREREFLKAENDLKYAALKRRWKKLLCSLSVTSAVGAFKLCPSWYLGCEMNLLQKELDKSKSNAIAISDDAKISLAAIDVQIDDERQDEVDADMKEKTLCQAPNSEDATGVNIPDQNDSGSASSSSSLNDCGGVYQTNINSDHSPAILPIQCCDSIDGSVQTELADAMEELHHKIDSIVADEDLAPFESVVENQLMESLPDEFENEKDFPVARCGDDITPRKKTNSFGDYTYLTDADCASDVDDAGVSSTTTTCLATAASVTMTSPLINPPADCVTTDIDNNLDTTSANAVPVTTVHHSDSSCSIDFETDNVSDTEMENQEVSKTDCWLQHDETDIFKSGTDWPGGVEPPIASKSTLDGRGNTDSAAVSDHAEPTTSERSTLILSPADHDTNPVLDKKSLSDVTSAVPQWISQMLDASHQPLHHSDSNSAAGRTPTGKTGTVKGPKPLVEVPTSLLQFVIDDNQQDSLLIPLSQVDEGVDADTQRHSWSAILKDSIDGDPVEQYSNSAHSQQGLSMAKPPRCPYCMPETSSTMEIASSLGDDVLDSIEMQAHVFAGRQPYDVEVVKQALRIIDKDVPRTDRDHDYFSGDDNPKLLKLRDALITYSFFHPDVGYAQGMNDLVSRFLVVMDTEADAYWMLVSYMNHFKDDFLEDGMLNKISFVEQMLLKMDRQLHEFLLNSGADLMFCHRWLLLSFKREFCYDDALRIFEIISSRHLEVSSLEAAMERSKERAKELERGEGTRLEEIDISPEYSFDIFVCVALLREYRVMIMSSKDTSSVYQVVSCLPKFTDVTTILMKAEDLFYKYCRKSVVDCFQVIDEHELKDCTVKRR